MDKLGWGLNVRSEEYFGVMWSIMPNVCCLHWSVHPFLCSVCASVSFHYYIIYAKVIIGLRERFAVYFRWFNHICGQPTVSPHCNYQVRVTSLLLCHLAKYKSKYLLLSLQTIEAASFLRLWDSSINALPCTPLYIIYLGFFPCTFLWWHFHIYQYT